MANPRLCLIPDCGKPHYGRGWCNAHYQRWWVHGDPLAGSTPKGEPARYLYEEVLTYNGDECLAWPFARDGSGYGQIRLDSKTYTVSRLVCEATHGAPRTPNLDAAHSCGKGHLGCVTKGHLSWKSRRENVADMVVHGTISRGSKHGSKLTEADVLVIRSLRGELTVTALAQQFGVAPSVIHNIQTGKRWAWLKAAT